MHRHGIYLLCAVLVLAGLLVVFCARPGSSQPPDEQDLGAAIRVLQGKAVKAWLDVAQQLEENPLLLERGGEEAEEAIAYAEGLGMVVHRLMTTMDPRRREMQLPPTPGRFQFVEWAQEPMQYWVIDTVTGELDRRRFAVADHPPLRSVIPIIRRIRLSLMNNDSRDIKRS